MQGQSSLFRQAYSEHVINQQQKCSQVVTKGHVCDGADGMPDDPPKLNGAAAEPKGAAAVPSPLPLAAAPPASPDIGELLGGPHVKLKPPVSPLSTHQGQLFNRYVCPLGDNFVPDKNMRVGCVRFILGTQTGDEYG